MRDLRVISNFIIKQVESVAWPTRTNTLIFDFCAEFEGEDSWETLTNAGKITLPKKVSLIGNFNKQVNIFNKTGQDSNLGGFSALPPVFLRGDAVTVRAGYKYRDGAIDKVSLSTMFQGYISNVNSKTPFTLDIEDNMWLLKQAPAQGGINGTFPYKTYTVETMLKELIKNASLPFTVNSLTSTNLGIDFRIERNTIGQILERLRHDHYLKSYFRGNDLRCGSAVYIESEASTLSFTWQENIIEDDLIYRRKDDIVLSAIATSTNKVSSNTTTKDGKTKTKSEKLEVFILFLNGVFTTAIKKPGSAINFPINNTGERREFYYNNVTDANALIKVAKEQLLRYYFDGYRGTFTTFGMPFVKQGDNAQIDDKLLPERNGTYKIKSVGYKLSADNGLRQVIELDYKIK
jgi:hypothetical protein